ncbi:MAG TPA: proton-conducting transporter membrane subunit, partial [Elusimicrobiales bacterium]|nr:proton-conducting transporter membrane subunit [Elusimicrobiales bacterium]
MTSAAVWLPALAGVLAAFSGPRRARQLLLGCAMLHSILCLALWAQPGKPGPWLMADAAGLLFLSIASLLFLLGAVYAGGYLRTLPERGRSHIFAGLLTREPDPVFIAFMLLFLSSMSFVCLSRHIGIMWVALEATTVATAPLICFHRKPSSLEAAWKYLLLCSVGIALALLGNFFISAALPPGGVELWHDQLRIQAAALNPLWLKIAFIMAFVGYGTKMGLAPMHTWLPDAHSESPAVISALLSGALLNCAFLALARVSAVCASAGLGSFVGAVFMAFGLVSVVVAAALMLRQKDFKRLLAYSSVENMGITALAYGAGVPYVALLHALNHSLVKAPLFMLSGNILRFFKTKKMHEVSGLAGVLPVTGLLWAAGFLAILGMPPFGIFVSKLLTIKALVSGGRYAYAALFLFMLAVVFSVTGYSVLAMFRRKTEQPEPQGEGAEFVLPPLLLLICSLALGL